MKDWLREPLVHFLLIGAVLFLIAGTGGSRPLDTDIVIGEADVARLVQLFAAQWQRPPTREELDRLVEQQVREEVLYREAVAMGLDRGDTIVRRRLVQKLEFLSQDLVDENPSEADLRGFYDANLTRFEVPAVLSFQHVYLNPDDRRENLDADMDATLAALQSGADPEQLGDTFLLPLELRERSQRELAGLFGTDFAESLAALPLNEWVPSINSGYGAHVVRVTDRVDPYVPELGAVRDDVRREFLAQAREDADAAMYAELRARYRIDIAEIGGGETNEQ